jgi:diaminopimelate decarboxylase/diaminopimelate epimerase
MSASWSQRRDLFPDTTEVVETPAGQVLAIAGSDLSDLADRYGTPLYLYDRATLDAGAESYRAALAAGYAGPAGLTYAGKAFLCTAVAQWAGQAGLWVDCTGLGEIGIALAAGVPREQIAVHGVNKSRADLVAAVAQAGTLVVDNLAELERLVDLWLPGHRPFPDLWLRFRPGVAVDTHAHIQTGQHESKFGMDEVDVALAARVCREHGLPLSGLHFHLGSQFRDPAPIVQALDRSLDLAAAIGLEGTWVLSPGGGWGVAYHEEDLPQPAIGEYVRYMAEAIVAGCQERGLSLPRLQLEPGRSLVARAGVALYRVGAVKQSAQRRWLLLDGGLADNPRPALYGARYAALPVWEPGRPAAGPAWLAGPYCESGDVLIEDLPLPEMQAGELVAIPASGAYQLSMASNYNGARRPAVFWLEAGAARLIQARETPQDLLRRDRRLGPGIGGSPGRLPFARYQALGNDYLVIDPADLPGELSPARVRRICDRHYGAGSDGLLLGPFDDAVCDFRLRLFNPDGGEFEKSGNGLRIFARYLWERGLVGEEPFTIATPGGPVMARVDGDGRRVTVEMGTVSFDSRRIPVAGPPREVLNETLVIEGRTFRYCAATIGNPHCVVLCDEVSPGAELGADARRWGPLIEREARFPNRTNVQFMQVLDRANVRIEIWERGVGYTLASGSSSCAAAAVAYRLGLCDSQIAVHMPGGVIDISVSKDLAISMAGPVAKLCEGVLSAEVFEATA